MKSWNNITWQQFLEIKDLKDDIEIICKLEGLTKDQVETMKLSELKELMQSWDLSGDPKANAYATHFVHENVLYALIPMHNLTISEWDYISSAAKENDWLKLFATIYRPVELNFFNKAKLIAYIKAGKHVNTSNWKIEEYDYLKANERAEIFKTLPVTQIFTASLFFSILVTELLKRSPDYLNRVMDQAIKVTR